MPTSSPPNDLPAWATGSYPGAGPSPTWEGTPRRVATGITGFAAAGLIPAEPTDAQSFNEWLARVQEWIEFGRGEAGTGVFGDGSDGVVTLGAGTTTLTRDMYYDDLTVPNGATLAPAGYRVFVAGLLTVGATGVIHVDGGAGSGTTGGAAGGGTAGTTPLSGGAAGGAGRTNAGLGTVGTASTVSLGGSGGAGGLTTSFAAPAGGVATAPAAGLGGYRHLAAAQGRATLGAGSVWTGGGGGGGGSCENGNTGTSGGGGGGAGVLVIFARRVSNAGAIRANGGAGAAATLGNSTEISGGGGGGGGGIYLVHREAVGATLGTVTASAGAGGAGAGTGNAGASGSAGLVITLVA